MEALLAASTQQGRVLQQLLSSRTSTDTDPMAILSGTDSSILGGGDLPRLTGARGAAALRAWRRSFMLASLLNATISPVHLPWGSNLGHMIGAAKSTALPSIKACLTFGVVLRAGCVTMEYACTGAG